MTLVPLSPESHGGLAWQPPRWVEPSGPVPVSMAEVYASAVRVPLSFSPLGEPPDVTIRTQSPGASLLDAEGRWRAPFLPGALAQGPFALLPTETGTVVTVDPDRLVPEGGAQSIPLFAADGKLTSPTAAHLERVRAWHAGRRAARKAAAALEAVGMLIPDPAQPGSRTVDSAALTDQLGQSLERLHAAGALRLAHAVEMSRGHVGTAPRRTSPAPRPDRSAPDTQAFLDALRADLE